MKEMDPDIASLANAAWRLENPQSTKERLEPMGFTRGKEQANGLRLEEENNALWKHCLIEYGGEKVDFSMEVLGSFQSAMARQVNEGVRIQKSKSDCQMNSKSEFHQHPVVRVVPVRGLQQEQGEDRGQGGGNRGQGH